MKKNINWKTQDEEYIFYMQKFLDICDNIEDEDLKSRIIRTMIVCDDILTNLAIKEIEKVNKKEQ